MAYEFKLIRNVEFAETDMVGIMHFSNFFRLMEETEHAFFRSLGISVHQEFDNQLIGWPRVNATCEYSHPLRFEDEVEIHLLVKEIRGKSITFQYRFRKVDGDDTLAVARGEITTICVQLNMNKDEMDSIAIPQQVRDKIDSAPPEMLKE
jgi:YbgC/YbaW family acyl-CoA thioester hydrolase